MSFIAMSVSKQVNEWEEFTMYHYNVFSKQKNNTDSCVQFESYDISETDCVEFAEPSYARSYLKTRIGWLVEKVNSDSRIRVLFTSIDTSSKKDPRVYFCIKPTVSLSSEDLDTYIDNAMKECVSEVFRY